MQQFEFSLRSAQPVPTQGSKKAVPLFTGKGKSRRFLRAYVVDMHEDELKWLRHAVKRTIQAFYKDRPIGGDAWVNLKVQFMMPRPKGHYGTGRNAGLVKRSARPKPTVKPDSLKMCRAIEDALSGVLVGDDAQICEHDISKEYWEQSHYETFVTVTVHGADLPLLPPHGAKQEDEVF